MSRTKLFAPLLIVPLIALSGAAYATPRDPIMPRPQSQTAEAVASVQHHPGYKCVTLFGPHFGLVHIPERS